MDDKAKADLLKHAMHPPAPHDDWKIIWGCGPFDAVLGADIIRNTANFSTKRVGESFQATDPHSAQIYTFDVYELTKRNGEMVHVANCEISPGVYASAVRTA